MRKKLPKLIVILGPTASGKTDLAIKLAIRLSSGQAKKKFGINGVEIVSADSRQIYKGMDIGTAKPLNREFTRINHEYARMVNGVPHYLMDLVWPDQEFSVAIYKKLAIKAIQNIQRRGKLPFLVGGTGLYIQSVVNNIKLPKVPPQKRLRKGLERKTEKELFRIYKKLDPEGAKFIDRENKRRLIRAIEVCKVTKKPFWQQRKKGKSLFDILEIGIKLPKTELKKRVEKRVEKMFKLGLEREVRKLVRKYGFEIPPMQTIGYQEWKEYFYPSSLRKGGGVDKKNSREEVKQLIILHTLQFAKRQMTWFTRQNFARQNLGGFKRNKRIHWIKNFQQAEELIKESLSQNK